MLSVIILSVVAPNVTNSEKHSSLLRYRTNYSRKSFTMNVTKCFVLAYSLQFLNVIVTKRDKCRELFTIVSYSCSKISH